MKSFFVFVLILLQTSLIFAQRNFQQPPAYSPQLTAELKQLQEAALKSDYAWDQLAHLTNNIGPRPAGSVRKDPASPHGWKGCDMCRTIRKSQVSVAMMR